MRLERDSITLLASEGRVTLQVPDMLLVFPGDEDKSDPVDYPDDWFVILKSGVDCDPAVGKEGGFTYLSRKGYEANKVDLKKALAKGAGKRGHTWAEFEKHAEEHFAKVEKRVAKKLKMLRDKIAELEKFVP